MSSTLPELARKFCTGGAVPNATGALLLFLTCTFGTIKSGSAEISESGLIATSSWLGLAQGFSNSAGGAMKWKGLLL